jgi:hypothetical protein
MTNTNAPITDVFPEGERTLPRINRQDKIDLPAHAGNPPALCPIVEPFMLGTIPEFHAHRFLDNRNALVKRRSLLLVYRRKDRWT